MLHDEKDVSHPVRPDAFDENLRQHGCLTLSVKDSGAGMSEDNLKVRVICGGVIFQYITCGIASISL